MKHLLVVLTLGLLLSMHSRAEGPAVVAGNGQVIGSYVGSDGALSDVQGGPSRATLRAVSPTGYLVNVFQDSGAVAPRVSVPGLQGSVLTGTLYFESSDCTGPAYFWADFAENDGPRVFGGVVVRTQAPGHAGLWFTPKTAQPEARSIGSGVSVLSISTCFTTTGLRLTLPAFPNDPQVTGVSAEVFVSPVTISQADVPRVLFRDGFELRVAG